MSPIAWAASARSWRPPPTATRSAGAWSIGDSGRALSTTTQMLAGSSIDSWPRSKDGWAGMLGTAAVGVLVAGPADGPAPGDVSAGRASVAGADADVRPSRTSTTTMTAATSSRSTSPRRSTPVRRRRGAAPWRSPLLVTVTRPSSGPSGHRRSAPVGAELLEAVLQQCHVRRPGLGGALVVQQVRDGLQRGAAQATAQRRDAEGVVALDRAGRGRRLGARSPLAALVALGVLCALGVLGALGGV